MDRLSALEAFVTVADQRGFASAARKLRLSPSAVTRLVSGLEDHLGVRLLTRTTRAVSLTDDGARFLDRARRIVSDLSEAEASARRERTRPTGTLVLNAPVLFGRMHVSAALAEYLGLYPDVGAELQLNDRNVNLVEEGVDLAVRIGDLQDSSMIARRVGATRWMLVASPKYLRASGRPKSLTDLARHALIGFTTLQPQRAWNLAAVDLRPRLVTNSAEAAIGFALRGLGLTFALSYQVQASLQNGELVAVLEDFAPPPLPIQLVYPSSRLLSAKVRLFVELVAKKYRWEFAER